MLSVTKPCAVIQASTGEMIVDGSGSIGREPGVGSRRKKERRDGKAEGG